ncbi:N-terminal nucleophile aminohydrolase [Dothidotthia symphoricarpi CBS 119687]|uniref:N-terminal nucleophile aminohydrolase n=1 Tax=Dothidotthia symphoricarpi CBS 119687 TaxID=1392245 RepID=A0A6A6A6W1_9PLEO|nr:N-terminal nucleophile aminohydrolase [Dothidotthia symphoricarpi CBS 119687]KAF2126361.1 N-terminal nucleophile aminohydrolase [Dothidotthia symphoricarpi CBS 119687]
MCRFMVYKGKDEILLSELILNPSHSILTQSFDSRLRLDRRRPHNGDGFGIGYYTSPCLGPEPCVFTSTIPAWNCINLSRIASKTTSSLIFAHVRATTEGNLSDSNCHPFSYKSLMFMHNGGIGCFKGIKRRLALSLNEQWFTLVQGSTDSEWAFALFLDCLDKAGISPDSEPGKGGFGHTVLRKAMLKTIERINEFIRDFVGEDGMGSEDSRSLLNFAVTDGESVVCTRYVSSKTDEAASLFFSSGTSWKELKGEQKDADSEDRRDYVMERRDKGSDIVLVASEPLTFERDNWVTVPTNSTLTISKQTVMIHPIIDAFYSTNPAHERSAGFAQAKGQTVTGPDKRVLTQGKTSEDGGSGRASPLRGSEVVTGAIRRLRME